MGQGISEFIGGFNGGTRLNRFAVTGNIGAAPGLIATGPLFTSFHIRSATLPEAIVGEIPINYRGRTVSYPGDRIYKPWNITILDDTGALNNLHKAFHDWSNKINAHEDNINTVSNGVTTPRNNFATNWTVKQYDPNGARVIKTFNIQNCWPTIVGPIQLDMAQDNTLAQFAVSLMYTHFTYTLPDT
jgi:hypothetical protein